MTLSLNLTPEQETALRVRAELEKKTIEDVALNDVLKALEKDKETRDWLKRCGVGDWTDDDERAFKEVERERERIWPEDEQ